VLQSYNYSLLHYLEKDSTTFCSLDELLNIITEYDLRITIMDIEGNVLVDNKVDEKEKFTNHLDREEVIQALANGEGYSIRKSDTMDEPFFYAARKSDKYIARSALPFNFTKSYLTVDKGFILFFVLMAAAFIGMVMLFSFRLGKAISSLREFSYKAENNELKELNLNLPNNDIGDITHHIIQLYIKLNETKQDLSWEKEKLIKHLQISKEGLAVFSGEKKVLFTNTLFIQNINLISDKEISSPEGVFEIEDLSRIKYFLNIYLFKNHGQSEYLSESLQVQKNGKIFNVETIIFQDNSFEISITNITQQEEETRLKRQLTQNVAHELKTPVSSIKGYLETITENPGIDDSTKTQFIERCLSQANRLTELLKDISVLNRIDDAHTNFDISEIDIEKLVRELLQDSASTLCEKNMDVSINIPKDTVVEGNQLLIYSIFRNLLDNSIAYAGDGKSIFIKCYRKDDDAYYFSFADNGVGVDEQHINRIFERFYRVDKGRSRKLGGTGLGLAIVKNAVLFHKGEISAKPRPESGIEFLFSLKRKHNNTGV
jgi:Signal transduction histidine kinase